MKRSKDYMENYYGDIPTAQVDAIYKQGKFVDMDTEKEIIFKENSIVKITTRLAAITDEDYKRHTNELKKEILPKDSIIYMRLPMESNSFYILKIKLNEPLAMTKIGNKDSVCNSCKCSVIEVYSNKQNKNIDFESIEANSLNQIFFLSSSQFRKNNKSHTANIYKCTYLDDGILLDNLRF